MRLCELVAAGKWFRQRCGGVARFVDADWTGCIGAGDGRLICGWIGPRGVVGGVGWTEEEVGVPRCCCRELLVHDGA